MPRTKLTESEQVVKRHQQAEEAQHKHHKKMLFLCVKHYPQCVASLWQQAQSLGYSETKILQAQEKLEKDQNDTKRKRETEVKIEPNLGFVAKEPVKEKCLFVRDLDLAIIRDRLLPHIEAGALSSANMRRAEKLHSGKRGLLRILELATGIPEGMELTGRLRCLHELTTYCEQRAAERGHRCARFQVGAEWDEIGIYKMKGANAEGITVWHRFMDSSVTLAWSQIPHVENLEELKIQNNWSETEACLAATDVKAGESVVLLKHFPDQTFDSELITPPPKTRFKGKPASPLEGNHPLQRKLSFKDDESVADGSVAPSSSLAEGPVTADGYSDAGLGQIKLEMVGTQLADAELNEMAVVPPLPPAADAS